MKRSEILQIIRPFLAPLEHPEQLLNELLEAGMLPPDRGYGCAPDCESDHRFDEDAPPPPEPVQGPPTYYEWCMVQMTWKLSQDLLGEALKPNPLMRFVGLSEILEK
jgi:hypothetical protein